MQHTFRHLSGSGEHRMHNERLELWRHQHTFNIEKKAIERRTLIVVIITFAMMIAEIVGGWLTNSMALFADGWHMGTHAFALGISLLAYILARKYAQDQRFTFGTWKIEILGAYTSAIVLGMVGLLMVLTSLERLINPQDIQYDQALIVAVIGLVVNLVCAAVLNAQHIAHDHGHHHAEHGHDHQHEEHGHDHHHGEHTHAHLRDEHDHASLPQKQADLNLKSAYLHVLADALTSVLAIVALFGAKYLRLNWLDPFMGIVGATLIFRWALSLLRDTSGILLELEHETDVSLVEAIKAQIESDGDTKISDLHLWKVAQSQYACIVSLVAANPCAVEKYKERLDRHPELVHVTIEVNLCQGAT
jgi:cation diffusion facilitator family transporter